MKIDLTFVVLGVPLGAEMILVEPSPGHSGQGSHNTSFPALLFFLITPKTNQGMSKKKNLVLTLLLLSSVMYAQEEIQDSVRLIENAEVRATRWNTQTLTPAVTKIKVSEMPEINTGMDIPQTLQSVPSLIYSSDAGNSVGYTSMKIRGSDATRINVTINGVPYNDAESQGTFFVDIADIISSTDDIVITNGIGSSTNGTGALGASINIGTRLPSEESYASVLLNAGSFNTLRGTLKLGTGRLGKYKLDARLSSIQSDGYIDRASSRLGSWMINQSYDISDKHYMKLILFGAKERTGQAWNGMPISVFEKDPTTNTLGEKEDGSYYDDQVDDYTQNHLQFFINSQWNPKISSSIGLYGTMGKGYYEEYKQDQSYSDYGLPNFIMDTSELNSTSLVRQLWLDNVLMGINTSLEYSDKRFTNILGLGAYQYKGKHYGQIIWATQGIDKDYRWYDNEATKSEFNIFNKFFYKLDRNWVLGLDLQYRGVGYEINGFRDNPELASDNTYSFFNPKFSVQKSKLSVLGGKSMINFFVGRASKEPIRSDFETSTNNTVLPESVVDVELSMDWRRDQHFVGIGLFGMFYKDQLILTGKLNDVGAYIRQNVDQSKRMGIELRYRSDWNNGWYINSNASISLNKIKKAIVYYDDYDAGGQIVEEVNNSDISYSPNRIGFLQVGKKDIQLHPKVYLDPSLRIKSVSKQYLDITENVDRMIPSYTTVDIILGMDLGTKRKTSLYISALNILNTSYYSNGYTFSYLYSGAFTTENYIFPQARFNYNVGLKVDL